MKCKKFLSVLGCFCFMAALLACRPASSDPINWYSYDKGLEAAKADGKKAFLYFYTERCGYCKKMQAETFRDAAFVSYLNENFIPVKIDAAKERNVSSKYNIRGVPATWIVTADGEKIPNRPGYIGADVLLPLLKYYDSDNYKDVSFQEFMKTENQ